MRIKLTVKQHKFKTLMMVKALRDQMTDSFIGGFEKFVEHAAPNVPIDTGMARGSFLNAIAFLRSKNRLNTIYVPTTPQRVNKDGTPLKYTHSTGKMFYKTPLTSKILTTKQNSVFTYYNNKPKINYYTSVVHYNINDPKWQSFEIGRQHMMHHIRNYKYNLELTKFVAVDVVTYGE